MPDFLLELMSEEIPARMQREAATQLAERFAALLADAGIAASGLETFVTPRRLALLAHGLPAASEGTREERRGPRADAPAPAIAGFLKSTGLSRDRLEERETDKGCFLFAVIDRPGRPVAELLAERLPGLIEGFQWPKSMRWLSTPFRWVRPLRGIMALLDAQVVQFEVQAIAAGRKTHGHRLMRQGTVELASAAGYVEAMRAAKVVVDAAERAQMIRDGSSRAAAAAGLQLLPDDALVAENAGLTEWPVPLLGRFAPEFRAVPPEIIQLTMKVNQKYFAVTNPDGTLAPAFVCVANLDAPDGGKTIVAGNERVLSARLADARFFWAQDGRTSLDQHAGGLAAIVFHEKLGTMAEKVDRVAMLARWLVETYPDQFPGADADTAERAARLARADLTTGTVGEFPELQGIIGAHLAERQGEKPGVVSAIRQFYAPVPEGCVPVAVALADRADTISRFFEAGMTPTGSKDPFALRRAMLGIINIVRQRNLRFSSTMALFDAVPNSAIFDFMQDRLRIQVRDDGIRPDVIDSTLFWAGNEDIVRVVSLAREVQAFIETDDGANLLAGYKRAANILRAEEKKDGRDYALTGGVDAAAHIGETENDLARLFVASGGASGVLLFDAVDALLEAEDFAGAMQKLAALRAPVDAFFDAVVVNDPDPSLRARRLALLAGVRTAMHRVADFSRIEDKPKQGSSGNA